MSDWPADLKVQGEDLAQRYPLDPQRLVTSLSYGHLQEAETVAHELSEQVPQWQMEDQALASARTLTPPACLACGDANLAHFRTSKRIGTTRCADCFQRVVQRG